MRTTNLYVPALEIPLFGTTWRTLHRLFSSILTICLFTATVFFTNVANGQGPCGTSNCTSGDIRITKVELLKSDGTALPNACDPGQTNIQVKLRVTFDVTSSTRYGFLVVGKVWINNSLAGTIANCDPATFSQGVHTMDVNQYTNGDPILWPCGSTIQLKDVYTAWDQQAATISNPGVCTYLNSDGTISNCGAIDPKCKFYGDNEAITVYAPLIANFSWSGSCVVNHTAQTIAFTNTTSGGKPGYTYVWDFGDGSSTSTATNPSHDYTTAGNYTVTLTATDATTPTGQVDVQQTSISVTSCCTSPVINSDPSNQSKCEGSNTSFTVGFTGGVPSPTIQWQVNTGSGFANISNGGVYSGATTSTLTLTGVTPSMDGYTYRAVLQSGTCTPVNSNSATLNVSAATNAGTLGTSNTICSGFNSGLLSLSSYTGNIVRWESSPNGSSPWTTISNTTSTYTSGNLTADIWYRVVVKSGVCDAANSNAVKITVQQPITNNSIAASQTICSASAPNALTGSTPTGGNGIYQYQWQSKTTGSFADIGGATSKDYAPGSLSQTTQYRRIVSAGVCSSVTSDAVIITISPESVVYSLMASNYCASNPDKGTIVLSGSYPGVSYQLKKQSDNSDVQASQTGNGSALTWINVDAGIYYVLGTGIAPTYCTSTTASATVHEFDCSTFYTLTQGYYGGKNGKSCIGTTPVNTIKYLLGSEDIIAGTDKSVTVPATDEGAKKLNAVLPGGSTPTGLPVGNCTITDNTCFKAPAYLTKQGKINNNLLSQTLTLELNGRWDGGRLLLFHLENGWLTTQKLQGCGESAVLVTQCADGTVSSIKMNENVVNYLGQNNTVKDLLDLANAVLGGTLTAGENGVPSYSDINDAVDAINKSFDEGRRFLDYYSEKQTCEMLFPAASTIITVSGTMRESTQQSAVTTSGISVLAYPNPYTDKVNFTIQSDVSGNGSLQVYNMVGQKVKTVYQGFITAGRQNFSLTLPAYQRTSLIYVFTVGDKQITGKLMQLNK